MVAILDRTDFLRRLRQGDFTDRQAEALADALGTAFPDPATKLEVGELRSEMRAGFARLEGRADASDARSNGRMDAFEARIEGRLNALDNRLEGRINALDAKLSERIERVADRTVIRLGAFTTVLFGLLLAALRLFPPT